MLGIDSRQVTAILRDVAEEIVLPRYRRLAAGDIREKRPGDLVTVADTEAEQALTKRLTALLPGSLVVGEEAASANSSVLDHLAGERPVWIIDPIDGTSNFVKGRKKFAIILALVVEGRTVHGWIHDPLPNRTATAELGRGAWMDGVRLQVSFDKAVRAMAGTVGYRRNDCLAEAVRHLVRQGSGAHDYLGLVENSMQFAYYRRLHPWDHAAGILLHSEAGGFNAMTDGSPYQPKPTDQAILLAPARQSWESLLRLVGG